MKKENNLEYLNIYGNTQQQIKEYDYLNYELLSRKLIFIGNFVKELKTTNFDLVLNFDHEYKNICFSIKNDNIKIETIGFVSIILNMYEYNIPQEFIEEHQFAINLLVDFEERFDYEFLDKKYFKKDFFIIDIETTEWIEVLFSLSGEKQYYLKFMNDYFNKILNNKDDIEKKINKV